MYFWLICNVDDNCLVSMEKNTTCLRCWTCHYLFFTLFTEAMEICGNKRWSTSCFGRDLWVLCIDAGLWNNFFHIFEILSVSILAQPCPVTKTPTRKNLSFFCGNPNFNLSSQNAWVFDNFYNIMLIVIFILWCEIIADF